MVESEQQDEDGVAAYFTDMETIRQRFEETISDTTFAKRIFVLHGVGGVGKSSLVRMFRLYCKAIGVPVALSSASEDRSESAILGRWAADFERQGLQLRKLKKRTHEYDKVRSTASRALKVPPSDLGASLVGAITEKTGEAVAGTAVGALLGSLVPGIGTAVGAAAGGALGGVGAQELLNRLKRILSRSNLALLLDPAAELRTAFIDDIKRLANSRRLVIVLDTYEQIVTLDSWVGHLAQDLPDSVLCKHSGARLRAGSDYRRVKVSAGLLSWA